MLFRSGVPLCNLWQRDVVRKIGKQCRDIRCTLDIGVAAKSEDASARSSDVSEQCLKNCTGSDDLRTGRVLCKAGSVTERRGSVGPGIASQKFGDFNNVAGAAAANIGRSFRGVLFHLFFEQLKYAVRILKSRICFWRSTGTVRIYFVLIVPRIRFFAVRTGSRITTVK